MNREEEMASPCTRTILACITIIHSINHPSMAFIDTASTPKTCRPPFVFGLEAGSETSDRPPTLLSRLPMRETQRKHGEGQIRWPHTRSNCPSNDTTNHRPQTGSQAHTTPHTHTPCIGGFLAQPYCPLNPRPLLPNPCAHWLTHENYLPKMVSARRVTACGAPEPSGAETAIHPRVFFSSLSFSVITLIAADCSCAFRVRSPVPRHSAALFAGLAALNLGSRRRATTEYPYCCTHGSSHVFFLLPKHDRRIAVCSGPRVL